MKKYLLLIFFLSLIVFSTYGQELTNEQNTELKEKVTDLLNKYALYGDLTNDGISISQSYKTEFKRLFKNFLSPVIYNDLNNEYAQYISVDNYISIIETTFPKGIEIKIDTISIICKEPIPTEQSDKFYVTVICEKSIYGLSDADKFYTTNITSYFTISFDLSDNNINNLKIVSIKDENTILKDNSNKKMKGIYAGIYFTPSIALIQISSNTQVSEIKSSYQLSFSAGIEANYFFNSHLGIGLGLGFSSFNNTKILKYSIENENIIQKIDTDNETYYLYVTSDIVEKTQ